MWILFSDEDKQAFEAWHAHDDAEDNFCELDGESSIIIWDSHLFLSLVLDINSSHCLPSSSFNELAFICSHWQRTNVSKLVRFWSSLWWLICIINSVDKTKIILWCYSMMNLLLNHTVLFFLFIIFLLENVMMFWGGVPHWLYLGWKGQICELVIRSLCVKIFFCWGWWGREWGSICHLVTWRILLGKYLLKVLQQLKDMRFPFHFALLRDQLCTSEASLLSPLKLWASFGIYLLLGFS